MAAAGQLQVAGTIDLSQFWPKGSADADTTTIHVTIGTHPFKFREHTDAAFKVTHVLDNAKVRGQVTKPCVHNGRITVRLEGVDAPELHYRPKAEKKKADQTKEQREIYLKWNHEYRQQMAETATVKLAKFLKSLAAAGKNTVRCRVQTAVDAPGDVYDTYGRFVGEIVVLPGEEVLNDWLLQQGWTVPAFYASMSSDEIERLTKLADKANSTHRGVWPYFSRNARLKDFNWKLVYRPGKPEDATADKSKPVLSPKLFRRLSTYALNKKAQMVTGTFDAYLKKKADGCHLTDEFLLQGPAAAPNHTLDEFLSAGVFRKWPAEVVFREKPSRVVSAAGKEIKAF